MATNSGYGPRKKKTMQDTFTNETPAAAKKINTSVWLDPDRHQQLKLWAVTNRTTLSAAIDQAIQEFLDHQANNR